MKKRLCMLLFALLLLCASAPSFAQGTTRALLVACSDFLTEPSLGSSISGNLHMVGSALISAGIAPSIEDGTIGAPDALQQAISRAFRDAGENDLSILYLCTHGILSSADDGQAYLLLGDGQRESLLSAQELYALVRAVPGEKLLIIDACYSGALIGRGMPQAEHMTAPPEKSTHTAPLFLQDTSIHVITSANGHESSWYYDSEQLETGAVSYFASALATGLGLYGPAEADLSGDGMITLTELHRHLSIAVPSSSCQLLSTNADAVALPAAHSAMLSRPLSGFSYGSSLLCASDPALDFSFTVTRENTAVQYRLISFTDGSWDWENAMTFYDEGDSGDGTLQPGRKTRTLTMQQTDSGDSGYLMLQVFSVLGTELVLCSERLIAVQPDSGDAKLSLRCKETLRIPGEQELPITVGLNVPAELTVTVYDQEGLPVRRLASGLLTRPSPGNATHLYWDGRDDAGQPVTAGQYVIAAETRIGASRLKATAQVLIGET